MRATVRSADKTSKQLRKKLARSAQRRITRKRRGANLDEISVQFVQFIGLVPVVVASHSDANLLSELHIALNSQLLPAREDGEKPRYAFRCQEATDGSCLLLTPCIRNSIKVISKRVPDDTAQCPPTLWGNVAIDLISPRKPAPSPTAMLPAFCKRVTPQRDTSLSCQSVLAKISAHK